jgi:hypothetical protein
MIPIRLTHYCSDQNRDRRTQPYDRVPSLTIDRNDKCGCTTGDYRIDKAKGNFVLKNRSTSIKPYAPLPQPQIKQDSQSTNSSQRMTKAYPLLPCKTPKRPHQALNQYNSSHKSRVGRVMHAFPVSTIAPQFRIKFIPSNPSASTFFGKLKPTALNCSIVCPNAEN